MHIHVCMQTCTCRHKHMQAHTSNKSIHMHAHVHRGTHKYLHGSCTHHRELAAQDHLEQFTHLPQKK